MSSSRHFHEERDMARSVSYIVWMIRAGMRGG
jgi:hypothetical protein